MKQSWLIRVLALMALLLRTLRRRGKPQLSGGPCDAVRTAYSWESCRDCRASLPGHVYRLLDESYCRACHEAHEDELDLL